MPNTSSAYRHGVDPEDWEHALRFYVGVFEADEDGRDRLTMVIGPARNGDLLEVGVRTVDGEDLVVHAMRARGKYLRALGI